MVCMVEGERVGRAEGEAMGELVPSSCTAPAKGARPDTLLQSAPNWHGPSQVGLVCPGPPNKPGLLGSPGLPGVHRPEQASVVRPLVSPYVPAGHFLHAAIDSWLG